MDFIKFSLSTNNTFTLEGAQGDGVSTIGMFLASDVNCSVALWINWILDDTKGLGCAGNITYLQKDGDYIFMGDDASENELVFVVKLLRNQLIQLLKDWNETVCKKRPKEVTIKFEDGEYTIETKE